jgi:hypothetical protein
MTVMRVCTLGALLMLFAASPAFAQPPQAPVAGPRVFVSGGLLADQDGTWGTPAATVGFSAAAGIDINHRTDVRLLVDVPKTVTVVCGRGCVEEHRSRSWSLLLGVHGALSDRVRAGIAVGFATTEHYSAFPTSPPPYASGATCTWLGFTTGVEVPVTLTSHLSVVPEAHTVWFPLADYGRTTIARPGVSLRWRF